MKVKKSLQRCPDCGEPLEFYYEADGRDVYYCPEGDEMYYFEVDGEYLYCVCQYDGKRICYGLASQLED